MADASSTFTEGRRAVRYGPRHGPFRVLLLAGTSEARSIAQGLTGDTRIVPTASLASPTRRPMPLGMPTRIGGWGGRLAFRDWLVEQGIDGIIDATHPFASQISHRTAEVADEIGIDYLQFLRPAWRPEDDDAWVFLNREEEAADYIPEGTTVFLATGRKRIEAFENLVGREMICRLLGHPEQTFPFAGGRYLVQQAPFSVTNEIRTLLDHKVDWLVVRNSGGTGSRAKVDAARALGLPVAVIRRPPQPQAVRVETIAEVLNWVRRRL